ncbi:MAG: glutamyl-tRNA reductase [Anaerovoracaceae bacterium]
MRSIVIGLNHRTAPVEVREKLKFTRSGVKHLLRLIRHSGVIDEGVLLSTCNRTELYITTDQPAEALEQVGTAAERLAGQKLDNEYFYVWSGTECMRHLLFVTSSLDSLIVGEGQILSQVKDAYHLARSNATTSTVLNTVFNQAIATGKKVRAKTRIACRSVSVSSAAVDLATDVLGSLENADILVIGAGKMSELTAQHLLDKGAPSIFVSNRNYRHARELADRFRGKVIRFDDFLIHAANADIVITSTGAPHYIILHDAMQKALRNREKKTPLVLIDIAVPRDVDPEVEKLDGIVLYNIDDMKSVVDSNKAERLQDAEEAREIVEEDLVSLKERLRYLPMRPVMVTLQDRLDVYRSHLVEQTMKKIPDLSDEDRHKIEEMSEKMMHRFLREPMMNMVNAAGTEKETLLRDGVSTLFMLDREKGEDKGRS